MVKEAKTEPVKKEEKETGHPLGVYPSTLKIIVTG